MTNADESKVTRPTAEAGEVEPVAMKPCPWCGGEVGPVVEEGARFRWRRVTGCCAEGPEVRHDTMADDQAAAEVESRAAAIAAWNNRPVEDTLRAQLEAAEARYSEFFDASESAARIAGWGGVAGDAPERIVLASEMYDGIESCDKWLDVCRVIDNKRPIPESATAYVRADLADAAIARAEAAEAEINWIKAQPEDDRMFAEIEAAAKASYQRHRAKVRGHVVTRSDGYESHVIWAALEWAARTKEAAP